MRKLEPKDIACNLPYKLTCLVGGEPDSDSETITGLSCDCHGWWVDFEDKDSVMLDSIMPILRPMSDITKPIEVNGETFIPLMEIAKISLVDAFKKGYWKDSDFRMDGRYVILNDHYRFMYENRTSFSWWNILGHGEEFLPLHLNLIFDKLHQWHFDYRGLIEQGLAIDINTFPA